MARGPQKEADRGSGHAWGHQRWRNGTAGGSGTGRRARRKRASIPGARRTPGRRSLSRCDWT